MTTITKEYIESLNYTDFISFLKETNRCPGGKRSLREIVTQTGVYDSANILDIGSNTGFNSLELAHITRSNIFGVDVSESCVNESIARLNDDLPEVKERVQFRIGSAYDLPFENASFDLVLCNGATSFMEDKATAVTEYYRVLKPWGFLAATQLFYSSKPPAELLEAVGAVLGVTIDYRTRDDWKQILNANDEHELYYFSEHKFKHVSSKEVEQYVELFLSKEHIATLDDTVKQAIRTKWLSIMSVFAENNDYLSFFIAIYRKNLHPEEPELFTY